MPQDSNGNYVAENALAYSVETNLKRTTLAQSGSMAPSAMPVAEGFLNVVPFWGDLDGEFSDNTESGDLTFSKLSSSDMAAPIINVEKGWTQNGIVDAVTMGNRTIITEMVARVTNWTQRQVNKIALQVSLAATQACNSASPDDTHWQTVLDVVAGGKALANTDIIGGCALFQERYDDVANFFCHSDVRAHLDKINLLSNGAAYAGQYAPNGTTTNGLAVQVDNVLKPVEHDKTGGGKIKVYPVILGAGQFAQYGDGSVARKFAHTFYDDVKDADRLSTRQRHSYALFGANFKPVAANRAATLAEITNPANWESAFDGIDMGNYPFRSAVMLVALEDGTIAP